jgi:hypothetical protein
LSYSSFITQSTGLPSETNCLQFRAHGGCVPTFGASVVSRLVEPLVISQEASNPTHKIANNSRQDDNQNQVQRNIHARSMTV